MGERAEQRRLSTAASYDGPRRFRWDVAYGGVVEISDALLDQWFGDETPTPEQVAAAVRGIIDERGGPQGSDLDEGDLDWPSVKVRPQ